MMLTTIVTEHESDSRDLLPLMRTIAMVLADECQYGGELYEVSDAVFGRLRQLPNSHHSRNAIDKAVASIRRLAEMIDESGDPHNTAKLAADVRRDVHRVMDRGAPAPIRPVLTLVR